MTDDTIDPMGYPIRTPTRKNAVRNDHLIRHRPAGLEHRMDRLERKVDHLAPIGTRVETQLNDKYKQAFVLKTYGGLAVSLILTLVGHIPLST